MRFGKLSRVKVYFPLSPDRKAAGNIDFASPLNRRTWRGEVPTIGVDMGDPAIVRPPRRLDSKEFLFINNAVPVKHVGPFEIATPSGIEPLINPPGTVDSQQGTTLNDPTVIREDEFYGEGGGEFFIGSNINTEYMHEKRYPYKASSSTGRLQWELAKDFENPTYPGLRYPKTGARKKK